MPDSLFTDPGYDHDIHRTQVRARGIVPAIARRGTRHGTGLGTYRWAVERGFAWLRGFGRLRTRWEREPTSIRLSLKSARRPARRPPCGHTYDRGTSGLAISYRLTGTIQAGGSASTGTPPGMTAAPATPSKHALRRGAFQIWLAPPSTWNSTPTM